ncbi:MAG: acyl-CoA thioesterase [Opitutae bacterium]|jgi:acyl-CoA thioester hydrolase|nr:acyl-CoA thioesterase [Opitutae bacterium]MBT5717660.1 acyl-CoA thioesterase [Opitutae bacterium]
MLSASVDIRVRYKETDKMGVVYHANYFTWFEVARVALLDELGCPYIELEKDGYFLPVLSCGGNFRLPAFFDDRLQVTVKIEKPPLVRIEALYEVKRKDELIATGVTKHAFVSSGGSVVRPPEKFVDLVQSTFSD